MRWIFWLWETSRRKLRSVLFLIHLKISNFNTDNFAATLFIGLILRTVGKASAFQAEKPRWFGATPLNDLSLSFPAVRGMITVPTSQSDWILNMNRKHDVDCQGLTRCELMLFLHPSIILKCQKMERLYFSFFIHGKLRSKVLLSLCFLFSNF